MRDRTWLLLALYGVLLVSAVSSALKGTRPKFKIATTSTTTTTEKPKQQPDNEAAEGNEEIESTTSTDVNATTSRTLTGIPQIDYIWDPNLPRELNGYNLSDYPFYSTIPNLDEIDFKCDGLHDGFYASVPHKCQVYHHCLYGTRYDFLCANFTAFDQKTFICHFASEVDCANSKKYWHRNDALYKAVSTSTAAPPPTTTITTTTTSSTTTEGSIEDGRLMPRRRRPFRRRPAYDYYDEEYYDDEYERPRTRGGYDRRDEYDYDDRQYSRRDNRERDRDHARNRDRNYREPVVRTRERIPNRNNWRDAPSSASRQPDDVNDDDRGKIKHHDDRRYEKGPAKYDYDQEPSAPSASGGLVKPAAASTSVYSRPRTPPKIRRPVPLSAQDKFAYKTSAIQPTVGDSHKRPIEPATSVPPVPPPLSSAIVEDDYYEDDVEDTRPRRPMRRRPYRERERHFYDQPRDMRDKERIRPMRTRYRDAADDDDDDDEMRPKKYPERPRERDRYYERSRDRALDREKDLLPERIIDEPEHESRPTIRTKGPLDDFIETSTRKNNPSIHKNNEAIMRTMQQHNNNDEISEQHRHLLSRPHKLKFDKQAKSNRPIVIDNNEGAAINNDGDKMNREQLEQQEKIRADDEYTSEDEYYDEPEYSPPSSPRTAVRIVKRPFLPSRGGNSNPRGLSPVGNKAPKSNRNNNTLIDNSSRNSPIENDNDDEYYRVAEKILHRPTSTDEKRGYNAYKLIQSDVQHKQQIDFNANSNQRRPIASQDNNNNNNNNNDDDLKPNIPWNGEETRVNLSTTFNNENRGIANENNRNNYDSAYTTEPSQKETNKAAIGSAIKQRINEVTHQLEDIPESEYDVTLNEALTPSLHQESTLPSGFIPPIQRHQNRDPVLQSSENNYRISRPYSNPHQHQSQAQQLQHHQQNGFIPSTQFVPLIRIGNSNNNNDERSGSVQYYKTPTVHGPGPGSHSRQSGRGPWHDYTGY